MISCIEQESLKTRRSIYALGNTAMVSDHCLIDTFSECLKNCPTPFNMQSARLAVLFNSYHGEFWNMVWKNLKEVTPLERLEAAKNKIASFARAYGTVLFFEDTEELSKMKKQYALYAANMKNWTLEANGMLQYMIWQALAENDEGASLQHYNELVEKQLGNWLNLPKSWKLIAQMPWGNIEKEAGEKTFLPTEKRMKIFR